MTAGWTDGQTNGRMDRPADGRIDGWLDGRINSGGLILGSRRLPFGYSTQEYKYNNSTFESELNQIEK